MNSMNNSGSDSAKGRVSDERAGRVPERTDMLDDEPADSVVDAKAVMYQDMREEDKPAAGTRAAGPSDETVMLEWESVDANGNPETPDDSTKAQTPPDDGVKAPPPQSPRHNKRPKHAEPGRKLSKAAVAARIAGVLVIGAAALIVVKNSHKSAPVLAEPTPSAEVTAEVKPVSVPEIIVINLNEPADISAAVTPADADMSSVEIVSQDEKTVRTDGLMLTGVAQGRALVTVKTPDGDKTCAVLVSPFKITDAIKQQVQNCGWYYRIGKDASVGNLFHKGDKLYWLSSSTTITEAQTKRLDEIASSTLGRHAATTVQKKPWMEVYSDSGKTAVMGQLAIATGTDKKTYVVIHTGALDATPEKVQVIEYTESSGTYTGTAKPQNPDAVSSVAISRRYFDSSTIGDGVQLSATVSPSTAKNKTITWKSSNTKVATVSSSGYVTIVGTGRAEVYAIAGGKTATCVIFSGS